MSSIIHQYIYKIIREEKDREPSAFGSKADTARLSDIEDIGDVEPFKSEDLDDQESVAPKGPVKPQNF